MAKKENLKKTDKSKNKKHFFKDFKAELKKVVWPTPKQLLNSTVAVITIVLVSALIVFVLDISFEAINKYGINKLQSILQNKFSTTETQNTTSNDNNISTDGASSDIDATVEETENTEDSSENAQ